MSLKMWTVRYYCTLAMVVIIAANIQLIFAQAASTDSADRLGTATCKRDEIEYVPYIMMSITRVDADDVIFNDDVLFEVHTRSEQDCAQECLRHEICITFTFMASQGLCRTHNDVMSIEDSHVFSPLAKAKSFVHTKALLCSNLEGYSWQAGHCVRPFDVTVSADDAKQMCIQNGGGHLVHLKTSGQLQLVQCVADKMGWGGDKLIWVGADDKLVEGEFRWSDGSLVSADLWATDQPDNFAGLQHCAGLVSGSGLYDRRCDSTGEQITVFVCQVEV